MKFSLSEDIYFEFQQWQIALLKTYIHGDIFEEDMKRRIVFALENPIHKYLNTHSKKITEKLKKLGVTEIPGNVDELAEFISNREDMEIEETEFKNECILYCEEEPFYTFKPHIMKLVKSFLKKDELDYLREEISHVFEEKIKRCLQRMHLEWDTKLSEKEIKIPIEEEEFVTLVSIQEDYKNRIDQEKNTDMLKKQKKTEKPKKQKKTEKEKIEKIEEKIKKLEEKIESKKDKE